MTGWATTGPCGRRMAAELAFGGTSIAGYTGICYFGEGAHNADDFCIPAFGVYVANADGSGHNLLALGGNPDWFVPSPGRPLSSFTHQCSGSVCDFDGSGSSDPDGTIASYAWQFGDGTSGSGPTPHHVYAIGDRYVVTLTVTDDTGTTGALNMTIDANAPPVAALTAACSGYTCTFDASGSSDPDGTIAFYSVSFGDGHSTGFMTLQRRVTRTTPALSRRRSTSRTTPARPAVQTTTITVINIPPVAAFTHACNGLTCSFDASGSADPDGNIHSYFGHSAMGAGAAAPRRLRQFAAAGTYVVTLTVFDNSGEKTVVSRTVSIANNVPPIAAFTAVCSALTCTFNGTGSSDPDGAVTAYSWAFGDGTTGVGAIVTHAYAGPGTYNVTLTVADNSAGTNTQSTGGHGRPHDARGRPGSRGCEPADGLDRGRHRRHPRRQPHAACGRHCQRLLEQRPCRVMHDQRTRQVHAVERRDSKKDWQHHVHGREHHASGGHVSVGGQPRSGRRQ